MFKNLTTKEQIQIERQKNNALQARILELEDALLEIADIVAKHKEDENGQDLLPKD